MQKEGVSLELSKADTYDRVAQRLAEELSLEDPQSLRFTQHNARTQLPEPSPLRFRQHETLLDMLSQSNNMSNIVYYEVLDMRLPELERLRVLQVMSGVRTPAPHLACGCAVLFQGRVVLAGV
jgi:ubiquitin carboxyl-terminal hydrolase 7